LDRRPKRSSWVSREHIEALGGVFYLALPLVIMAMIYALQHPRCLPLLGVAFVVVVALFLRD